MNRRPVCYKDWEEMEKLSGGDYLDTKNLLVYSTSRCIPESGKRDSMVFLKDLSKESEQRISANGYGESGARFSPDGKAVTFLSSGANGRQLYKYSLDDGTVTALTDVKIPMIDPLVSPDGKKVLFASPSIASGKADYAEPVVIETLNYKFDGQGFYRPDSFLQLWVYYIDQKELCCLTDGPHHFMHHNWMPDSQSVICGSTCFSGTNSAVELDLVKISLDEPHKRTRLTESPKMVTYPNPIRPIASADGEYIYAGFLTSAMDMSDDGVNYPEVYLYRVHADGCGMKCIFTASKDCYQCVQFPYNAGCGLGFDKLTLSEDGQFLYFFSGWQGRGNLYRVSTNGGCAETICTGKCIYNGMSHLRGGKAVVACSKPDMPEAYFLLDTEKRNCMKKVVQSNEHLLETVELTPAEDFFFDTIDGDGRVHGWVQLPAGFERRKKYPAIVYVHGGPHPFDTYGFTMEHQWLTASGFAVLFCNPRGSSSYGWQHQQMSKAFGQEAVMDILQFTDEACRRYPWIDAKHIGMTGGSYGGYMTNYMAAHTKRYCAYVSQRSIGSKLISYASSDMTRSSRRYQNFEEFLMRQLEQSPVAYADNIDKPFLILHGEDDYRTPLEGAHQLFTAIKDCHPELPVRMVIFPHTAHDTPADPALRRKYYIEMLEWFKTYLTDASEN